MAKSPEGCFIGFLLPSCKKFIRKVVDFGWRWGKVSQAKPLVLADAPGYTAPNEEP